MKIKPLVITVVALAILAAIVAIFSRPPAPKTIKGAQSSLIGKELLDRNLIKTTSSIILQGESPSVPIRLVKMDETWVFPDFAFLPVEMRELHLLLENLSTATYKRPVTSDPERMKRLELNLHHITLKDDKDQTFWEMHIGRAGASTGCFVRSEKSKTAWLASELISFPSESDRWLDRTPFPFHAKDIQAIRFEFSGKRGKSESLSAQRTNADEPLVIPNPPKGKALSTGRLEAFLRTLVNAPYDRIEPIDNQEAQEGLKRGFLVAITLFNGDTFTITIGQAPQKKAEKGKTPPEPSYFVTANCSDPENLLNKSFAQVIIAYPAAQLKETAPTSIDFLLRDATSAPESPEKK